MTRFAAARESCEAIEMSAKSAASCESLFERVFGLWTHSRLEPGKPEKPTTSIDDVPSSWRDLQKRCEGRTVVTSMPYYLGESGIRSESEAVEVRFSKGHLCRRYSTGKFLIGSIISKVCMSLWAMLKSLSGSRNRVGSERDH